jgi:hypothetical protein
MGKKSGSGIRIRDEQPVSYFRELRIETIFWVKILKFFDADPGPGIRDGKNLDPGWEKFLSGINIPDPQYSEKCKFVPLKKDFVDVFFYPTE